MGDKKNQNSSDSFDKNVEKITKIVDPFIEGVNKVVDRIQSLTHF